MKPHIVDLLASYGIHRIYEITHYSARDYLEKFGMSLARFEEFLDELNVLGIHLHFDSKWDQQNHRIRKKRREFIQYQHVPKDVVKWFDPYKHDTD